MADRDELLDFDAEYLEACNSHAWPELTDRLADTILVNGRPVSRAQYLADLAGCRTSFPTTSGG